MSIPFVPYGDSPLGIVDAEAVTATGHLRAPFLEGNSDALWPIGFDLALENHDASETEPHTATRRTATDPSARSVRSAPRSSLCTCVLLP